MSHQYLFAIFVIVFGGQLCTTASAQTTYWVNSVVNDPDIGDDDDNTGQSETDAFYSLGALPTIGSNTVVYLKRGGVYPGSIEISGSAVNVTIDAYGLGDRPVILGSDDDITDWQWDDQLGLWTAQLPAGHGQNVEYIFQNDAYQPKARHPNNGFYRNDLFTPGTVEDILQSQDLLGVPSDPGEFEIVIRTHNWQYDHVQGATIDPNDPTIAVLPRIGGSSQLYYPIGTQNWGFFLRGSLSFLDEEGEWLVVGDQLYYVAPNGNIPAGVRYAHRQNGIHACHDGVGSMNKVLNIEFRHQTGAAICFWKGNDHEVSNCVFRNVFGGIQDFAPTAENSGHKYMNNSFIGTFDNAILSNAGGAEILDSEFVDIALIPGEGAPGYEGYIAVKAGSELSTALRIEGNLFENIGYHAISVSGTGEVIHNSIINALATKNDGAAITFDHVNKKEFEQSAVIVGDLVVSNNIISDLDSDKIYMQSVAEFEDGGSYSNYRSISFGIYFGERVIKNAKVLSNVVSGCAAGIHFDHSKTTSGCEIKDNTLFNNDVQLSISDYSNWTALYPFTTDNQTGTIQGVCNQYTSEHPTIDGVGQFGVYKESFDDVYEGNIMYSLNSKQRCMQQLNVWAGEFESQNCGAVDFGDFSGNYYFNPFSEILIYQIMKYNTPPCSTGVDEENVFTGFVPDGVIPWTLGGWQQRMNEDLNSVQSPLRVKDYQVETYDGPVAQVSDPIDGSLDWTVSSDDCDCLHTPILEGGVIQALRTNDCMYLERWCSGCFPDVGSPGVEPGLYEVTYKLRSQGIARVDALQVGPIYQENGGTYSPAAYTSVPEEFTDVPQTVLIDVPNSLAKMVAAFQNVQLGMGARLNAEVDLDEFLIRKVSLMEGYDEFIAANHILIYNNPLAPIGGSNIGDQPYALEGCWKDVQGNLYFGSITLPDEWTSKVLYKWETDFDIDQAEYPISSGTEVWDVPKKIKGSVIVENGATLVIDGVEIQFAESTLFLNSDIVVEPGGTLQLINGAHLTSVVTDCGTVGMWNGVKVLGNGSNDGAGLVQMSDSEISNAWTAILAGDTDPKQPAVHSTPFAGGIVQAANSSFTNTRYGVVYCEQSEPLTPVENYFEECSFLITGPLNTQIYNGISATSLYINKASPVRVKGCEFKTTGMPPNDPLTWGNGITAGLSNLIIEPSDDGLTRTTFEGLMFGMIYLSLNIGETYTLDQADFINCWRGVHNVVAPLHEMTRCDFIVPDISGWDAYGASIYSAGIGFTHEENSYQGTGTAQSPRSYGLIAYKVNGNGTVYRSTFDGFMGESDDYVSSGLLVQADNSALEIKCNDFSNAQANDYDIAFTRNHTGTITPSVAGFQGLPNIPAGNTFSTTCSNPEQHMYVKDDVVPFTYWRHAGTQYYPNCRSEEILAEFIPPNTTTYNPAHCAPQINVGGGTNDLVQVANDAHAEQVYLTNLYFNWRDNGNTTGVIEYILNPANDSYAVRNKLMEVAPKVSADAWKHAFTRTPAMNSWHLAQALLANSPLEPQVIWMMSYYGLDPYYRQMVMNGQNGGVSTHAIYKSEISHFERLKTRALGKGASKAMLTGDVTAMDTLISVLAAMPYHNSRQLELMLRMANNDLLGARATVDSMRTQDPQSTYWELQHMRLSQVEANSSLADLQPSDIARLQDIVALEDEGSPLAFSWLLMLGHPMELDLDLPTRNRGGTKGLVNVPLPTAPSQALAYPNPSKGNFQLYHVVPEGVTHVHLSIKDALGRELMSKDLSAESGVADISCPSASGLHFVSLFYDGILMETLKLNLVR